MRINEEEYWALIQYIDQSDDEIIGFELEEFDEEEDFPDVCQVLRRLQGDVVGQVDFKIFLCPQCSRMHGIFEIVKE